MKMNRVNNPKNKILQFFCPHNNQGQYTDNSSKFCNIRGERRYIVCEDCGKILSSYFAEYEGMGFK